VISRLGEGGVVLGYITTLEIMFYSDISRNVFKPSFFSFLPNRIPISLGISLDWLYTKSPGSIKAAFFFHGVRGDSIVFLHRGEVGDVAVFFEFGQSNGLFEMKGILNMRSL